MSLLKEKKVDEVLEYIRKLADQTPDIKKTRSLQSSIAICLITRKVLSLIKKEVLIYQHPQRGLSTEV